MFRMFKVERKHNSNRLNQICLPIGYSLTHPVQDYKARVFRLGNNVEVLFEKGL